MNKIYNYIYFYFLFKLKWKLQNRKSMFPPTFDGFSQKNYCSLEEKLVITHYNRTLTIRIVHICPSFHFHSFFRPLRKLLYLSTLQSQRGVSNPPPKRRLNCAILTKKRHLSLGGTFQKGLILGSPTLMIHPSKLNLSHTTVDRAGEQRVVWGSTSTARWVSFISSASFPDVSTEPLSLKLSYTSSHSVRYSLSTIHPTFSTPVTQTHTHNPYIYVFLDKNIGLSQYNSTFLNRILRNVRVYVRFFHHTYYTN